MTAPETDAIEILMRLATDDNSHVEDVGRRATAQLTALRARLEAAEALRPELRVFARYMEGALRAHDDARGDSWKRMPMGWLIERLEEELSELHAAKRRSNFDGIVEECADIANFAMMIATLADTTARAAAPDADV